MEVGFLYFCFVLKNRKSKKKHNSNVSAKERNALYVEIKQQHCLKPYSDRTFVGLLEPGCRDEGCGGGGVLGGGDYAPPNIKV